MVIGGSAVAVSVVSGDEEKKVYDSILPQVQRGGGFSKRGDDRKGSFGKGGAKSGYQKYSRKQ